jgi:hypothetical protein
MARPFSVLAVTLEGKGELERWVVVSTSVRDWVHGIARKRTSDVDLQSEQGVAAAQEGLDRLR